MGAQEPTAWGAPPLHEVLRDQLRRHGFETPDPVRCAAQLEASRGPAARTSLLVDLGACNFLLGNVSAAMAAWRQAIVSGQPAPSARALYNLGLLHEHLGLHDQAIGRFQATIEHRVEPYASLATIAVARAEHSAGHSGRAMASLARLVDEMIVEQPDAPIVAEALLGLGDVAERSGQLDRALRAYRAASESSHERVRVIATAGLVRVLRFIGHDDEVQQLVDGGHLHLVDPTAAVDRVELLVRVGRLDEARDAAGEIADDEIPVHDRFRLITALIDLGMIDESIDRLEVIAEADDTPEAQARACYLLGEVYAAHAMSDPARAMLERVGEIRPGYWADKASLALGDLARDAGDSRSAVTHWADAAASGVDSVASAARHRLVDALEAVPVPQTREETVDISELATEQIEAVPVEPAQVVVPGPAVVATEAAAPGPPTPAQEPPAAVWPGAAVADPSLVADVRGEPPAAVSVVAIGRVDETPQWLETAPLVVDTEPGAGHLVAAADQEPAPAKPQVIPLRRGSEPKPATGDAGQEPSEHHSAEVGATGSPSAPQIAPDPPAAAGRHQPPLVDGPARLAGTEAATSATQPTVVSLSRGSNGRGGAANPYAALAPDALDGDPMPSDHDPYAELSPDQLA